MVESLNGRLWWNPTSGLYLAFVFVKEDVFAFVVRWEGRCTLYIVHKLVSPFPSSVFRLDTPCGKGGGPGDSTTSYHIC